MYQQPQRSRQQNPLDGARSDRLPATLPAGTFVMTKFPLNFSLAKVRHNAEVILKICELFIHGDINYMTKSFSKKNVIKIETP